jgi:uncharacterized protein (TIGR04141 family)
VSKKKNQSITVFLLKDSVNNAIEAIKEPSGLSTEEVSASNCSGTLFFKQIPQRLPPWVKFFQPHANGQLDSLRNSGTSAAFITCVGQRWFALTFGYGRTLLDPGCYEENFGLKVVLNSVDRDMLRVVDTQSLDAVPVTRRNQASVAVNIDDLGVDIEQILVNVATGKPRDQSLGRQITGNDAVKVTASANLEALPDLLSELLKRSSSEIYKQHFAWIDNLSEVRDKELRQKLDGVLDAKINANDFSNTWLAIPDVIDWSDSGNFRYGNSKVAADNLHEDIEWSSYLASISPETKKSTETFRTHQITRISASSEQVTDSWSVYRCIYCELKHEDGTFALTNGKWYRVDADFLNALNKIVKEIPSSKISLPPYKDSYQGEAEYNAKAKEIAGNSFALMDRQQISHGGGKSSIEMCDLYTTDRQLIHVKRYTGSSALSHLFAQGLASIELILGDPEFRKKCNDKLPTSHQLPLVSEEINASAFEVVYAVISNVPNGKLDMQTDIPLFSKISLRNSYRRLQVLRVRVSVCAVSIESEKA